MYRLYQTVRHSASLEAENAALRHFPIYVCCVQFLHLAWLRQYSQHAGSSRQGNGWPRLTDPVGDLRRRLRCLFDGSFPRKNYL